MILLDWYRQFLDIKYEFRERRTKVVVDEKICASCETLKHQLEIANYEKQELLKKILKEPEKPIEVVTNEVPKVLMSRHTPWNVRRQMLEAEDRVKAQRLRDAVKPDPIPTEELEKELDIAERTREEAK